MGDDILLQILKEDMDVEEAEERYRQVLEVQELLERYHDRVKWERDRRSQLKFAWQQGFQKGLQKARRQLFDENVKEGRIEGLAEAHIDVARRLKTLGHSTEEIADITGLSVGEVNGID